MAKGNPRDAERERRWRRHMRQQRRRRRSVREYCELHRLHESAFYFWRRVIADRDRERAHPVEPAFVPVTVVDPPTPRNAAVLDIRLTSGHRLRVRAGCDRQLLGEVIARLEGRSC
jgi:hypothetical protein